MPPNFIKAEATAQRLLTEYDLECPASYLEDIAYIHGYRVRSVPLSAVDAWVSMQPNNKTIVLNSTRTPRRQTFSLAHELGHILMHANISQGFLCTTEDLHDYVGSSVEQEANHFAAQLLMPKQHIPKQLLFADPTFSPIFKIGDQFKTTHMAAARRYVELTSHKVYLIVSCHDKILWYTRSKSVTNPLHNSMLLPKYALAQMTPSGSQSTEYHHWLRYPTPEVFETVHSSGSYRLTLLWLP